MPVSSQSAVWRLTWSGGRTSRAVFSTSDYDDGSECWEPCEFYPNVHHTPPPAYNDTPAFTASVTGVAVAVAVGAVAIDDSTSRTVTSCILTTFFLYG